MGCCALSSAGLRHRYATSHEQRVLLIPHHTQPFSRYPRVVFGSFVGRGDSKCAQQLLVWLRQAEQLDEALLRERVQLGRAVPKLAHAVHPQRGKGKTRKRRGRTQHEVGGGHDEKSAHREMDREGVTKNDKASSSKQQLSIMHRRVLSHPIQWATERSVSLECLHLKRHKVLYRALIDSPLSLPLSPQSLLSKTT